MRIWVVLAFVGIAASLAVDLRAMLRPGGDVSTPQRRMARALALRVTLSIVLFGSILLAWKLGYLQPNRVPL